MEDNFRYKFLPPSPTLADFVENIGMFHNASENPKEVVVVPDGRIDLFFSQSPAEPFRVILKGLETYSEARSIPPQTLTYTISFKPLAMEYIFQGMISDILNSARILPADFWGFSDSDLLDFDGFCTKANRKLNALIPDAVDERKRKLFALIYSTHGEMTVKQLSETVKWSSRQINRYFNQQFGLSLKVFCNILRFRKSLEHIAVGKLSPELNFTDQNHFIKQVKKFAGVAPKVLSKNSDDRFVLLSVLKQK